MHAYISVYVSSYVCMYVLVCTHGYVRLGMSTCMGLCIYVCMPRCGLDVYVYASVGMCVNPYVCRLHSETGMESLYVSYR